MNIENFEYLKKRLEQREWDHLVPQLEENMKAGHPEFSLEDGGEIDGKEVGFELKFRKHSEHDFYFFNRINASLSKDGVTIAKASFRESWNLKPEEMYRIMEYGSKVAVYKAGIKNDAGEPFNAYITVNVDKPLDDNGNLNLNTYHDNYYKKYPFDLDNALERLPVPIKELVPENTEVIKGDLKSGIPVAVTYTVGEEEKQGFLSIDARIGRVDILDSKMELVQLPKKQFQKTEREQQEIPQGQSTSQGNELKKKPWQNRPQRVNWNRNKQGKGMST